LINPTPVPGILQHSQNRQLHPRYAHGQCQCHPLESGLLLRFARWGRTEPTAPMKWGIVENSDVKRMVASCEAIPPSNFTPEEAPDGYASVPLCAIDSIYSIGVKYEGVRHVVGRYRHYWSERGVAADSTEHTTNDFLAEFGNRTDLADSLFQNQQRTSTRNGILKSDAVLQLLQLLGSPEFNIQTTKELRKHFHDQKLDTEIRGIRGQASGISAKYLFLLAGVEDAVKPDRMIIRFVSSAVGRRVTPAEAEALVVAAARELRDKYANLTPRILDHAIWAVQRAR